MVQVETTVPPEPRERSETHPGRRFIKRGIDITINPPLMRTLMIG
jgi:hypothetical protein